jgi:hypothetical protein
MREYNVTLDIEVNPGGLDAALRSALGSLVNGLSTYGPTRPTSIWLDDAATSGDDTTASTVATTHDPVFLSAERLTIPADGTTAATITVRAPRSGAAPVVLLVAGVAVPVTLTAGVGTINITSADPALIEVSVQNAANRSSDSLTVEAN